jgi:hypothetical protein
LANKNFSAIFLEILPLESAEMNNFEIGVFGDQFHIDSNQWQDPQKYEKRWIHYSGVSPWGDWEQQKGKRVLNLLNLFSRQAN